MTTGWRSICFPYHSNSRTIYFKKCFSFLIVNKITFIFYLFQKPSFCCCIPFHTIYWSFFSTEHLEIKNVTVRSIFKFSRDSKIVPDISIKNACFCNLRRSRAFVIFFDFSHADHSGRIMEIDHIQNITCASASSVFWSALCAFMWLLSKIDLLTILQSRDA